MKGWKEALENELERAEAARARGNEGQARVCARRAAGVAAREHMKRLGRTIATPSAHDLLSLLARDTTVGDELRRAADYLTMRVDRGFNLPVGVDLIAEARRLAFGLLTDNANPPESRKPPGDR